MPNEKPINFNTEMVQAILNGCKKQTRLLMDPQPEPTAFAWKYKGREIGEKIWPYEAPSMCPYGKKGDRIWVREAWCQIEGPFRIKHEGHCVYRADACDNSGHRWPSIQPGDPDHEVLWSRAIHMPRWASRITLEITTSVRVERVGDISEDDAWDEGIIYLAADKEDWDGDPYQGIKTFRSLWNSIYAKPKPVVYTDIDEEKRIDHYISYPFEEINEVRSYRGKRWIVCGNPWVWVINFKKL